MMGIIAHIMPLAHWCFLTCCALLVASSEENSAVEPVLNGRALSTVNNLSYEWGMSWSQLFTLGILYELMQVASAVWDEVSARSSMKFNLKFAWGYSSPQDYLFGAENVNAWLWTGLSSQSPNNMNIDTITKRLILWVPSLFSFWLQGRKRWVAVRRLQSLSTALQGIGMAMSEVQLYGFFALGLVFVLM